MVTEPLRHPSGRETRRCHADCVTTNLSPDPHRDVATGHATTTSTTTAAPPLRRGPLDRPLGPRGPDLLARRRPRDRPPQPQPLDLRRVPRLLRLGALERRRPAARRRRLQPHPRPAVLADRRAQPGRRDAADPLHLRRAALRRPQLDDHLGAPAADPGVRPGRGSSATRRPRSALLLACAALAGFGGGNFASSMTNISFFFPEAEKGKALGLNAAGGNLGTGIVQLVVPAVIVIGAGTHLERAGLMFIPLAAPRGRPGLARHGQPHRRQGRLPQLRRGHPQPAHLDHLVPLHRHLRVVHRLLGRLPDAAQDPVPRDADDDRLPRRPGRRAARPLGGMVADRFGGARVTIASFALLMARRGRRHRGAGVAQLRRLLRVVPRAVRRRRDRQRRDLPDDPRGVPRRSRRRRARCPSARKTAAGCIGIAGAVGAFGGFLIPRGFAMAKEAYGSLVPALWVFIVAYAVMAATTYAVYARRGSALAAETI